MTNVVNCSWTPGATPWSWVPFNDKEAVAVDKEEVEVSGRLLRLEAGGEGKDSMEFGMEFGAEDRLLPPEGTFKLFQ